MSPKKETVKELESFHLTDLIDKEVLQELQDGFTSVFNIASVLFDNNGEPITEYSGFSEFCRIARSTPEGLKRCTESGEKLVRITSSEGCEISTCCNFKDMLNGTVPIVIEDQHIANWGIGQAVTKIPEEEEVRRYAKLIGANENELVKASKELTLMNREQFEKILGFLSIIAKDLSLLGLRSLQQIRYINERKEMIVETRQRKEYLEKLLESSHDAIVAQNSEERIVEWNPGAGKLFGYKKEEVVGKNLDEIIAKGHPELKEARDISRRVLSGEDIGPIEVIRYRKDGTPRILVVSGSPIIIDKNLVGVLAMYRDITEKKETEKEIRRAEKLESLGILAGSIAHDFNNLLMGIMGNLELVQMKLGENGGKVLELVKEARNAARNAEKLTHQLLTFSKGGSPVKELSSIADVIRDSVEFVLRGSNIDYILDIDEKLPSVLVDKGQISEVVSNIVINAVQAMPEGGTIRISVSDVELEEDGLLGDLEAGNYIRVSIKDEGVGMSEKVLMRVFDPYFTTKRKGSGLGLSICYSIIKAHKGFIAVQSELDAGSTFTFYLKTAEREMEDKKEQEQSKGEYINGKVLLMDDDKTVLRLCKRMLLKAGFSVTSASRGEYAISLYNKAKEKGEPFDIVILDLTVRGGMGGKETLKRLKDIDPKVKAIVASGYSNEPVMSNPEKFGFKSILRKPYTLSEMKKVIKSILNST